MTARNSFKEKRRPAAKWGQSVLSRDIGKTPMRILSPVLNRTSLWPQLCFRKQKIVCSENPIAALASNVSYPTCLVSIWQCLLFEYGFHAARQMFITCSIIYNCCVTLQSLRTKMRVRMGPLWLIWLTSPCQACQSFTASKAFRLKCKVLSRALIVTEHRQSGHTGASHRKTLDRGARISC